MRFCMHAHKINGNVYDWALRSSLNWLETKGTSMKKFNLFEFDVMVLRADKVGDSVLIFSCRHL